MKPLLPLVLLPVLLAACTPAPAAAPAGAGSPSPQAPRPTVRELAFTGHLDAGTAVQGVYDARTNLTDPRGGVHPVTFRFTRLTATSGLGGRWAWAPANNDPGFRDPENPANPGPPLMKAPARGPGNVLDFGASGALTLDAGATRYDAGSCVFTWIAPDGAPTSLEVRPRFEAVTQKAEASELAVGTP